MVFNKKFWDDRYSSGDIGWDTGFIAPPIKKYIDQLSDKNLKILVPGAGNAYEVEYLYQLGFKNVHLSEWSSIAVESFKTRIPLFPSNQILENDFFNITGKFDLVLEYTFFCALDPRLRPSYVDKMHEIIVPSGNLVGVLFDWNKEGGPPFGGSKEEYKELFSEHFTINKMENCNNSIKPRAGKEVYIKMTRKSP